MYAPKNRYILTSDFNFGAKKLPGSFQVPFSVSDAAHIVISGTCLQVRSCLQPGSCCMHLARQLLCL